MFPILELYNHIVYIHIEIHMFNFSISCSDNTVFMHIIFQVDTASPSMIFQIVILDLVN